jgi:hypothetical protein
MRNLLILVVMILGIGTTFAQIKLTETTLNENSYGSFWGATNDTLGASDTIAVALRVRGKVVRDLTFQLHVTKVSGTVTNNFVFKYSMDGEEYTTTGDTIKCSNASTGLVSSPKNFDDYSYPYLKLEGISGATAQKARYKLWAISRDE